MDAWFHDTVSALAYSIARQHGTSGYANLSPPYNDLTRFALEQWGRTPDYLRLPMRMLTLTEDLAGLLSTGALFHSRPPEVRAAALQRAKKSSLSFRRDLVRYYESLVTLALYSRSSESGSPRLQAQNELALPTVQQAIVTQPGPFLKCEIAVVGSGPGGAITACLLAEAGRDVLLIEEGPYFTQESCAPFSREEMLQKYRNGGQTVALGKNKVAYVEGRCVGGGSEINSGLYHRVPPEILEDWRKEFEVEGLDVKEMVPHFEACERDLCVSLLPGLAPTASLKLKLGADRLGWKSLEVPRWFRYEGQTREGTRQTMTRTYIPRFLGAAGRLLTETRVRRLDHAVGRWRVEARHRSAGPVRVEAESVFVCAGAVQTPALLRRSGIKGRVGDSLRLHPTVKVVAEFGEPVNSADMGVPVHQVKEFAPRLSFGCSISSPPYLALGLLDYPDEMTSFGVRWPHMANYYAMVAAEGTGNVRPLPGFRDVLVRHNLTQGDRCNLADGLGKLCKLLFEAGARALFPSLQGGLKLTSVRDLERLPSVLNDGQASLMTIHLFSTCPMGERRTRAAVDSFGKVHGFEGLYVSDASLLCGPPGVNPQGTIMALARRNALHFLQNRRHVARSAGLLPSVSQASSPSASQSPK